MRKFLIPLLLASALAPAAAVAQDGGADSESASDNRPQRVERADRPQRAERADRPQRAERADRPQRAERADRPVRIQQVEQVGGDARVERAERPERIERVRRIDRDRRIDRGRQVAQQVERQVADEQPVEMRTIEPVQQTRQSSGSRFVDGLRDGIRDRPELKRRERERERWRDEWRRDSRYNWWSYRNRYGSLYRLGRYYDPYGWGYRRFSIGFTLWPSYYGSHYWLNDPWRYRLPPAYGPYRWVRYYDDALLVDIYTGQVVDVIHNFFW